MFNLTKSFNKTIMRKKLLFRSWLLLALMLVGAGSAWGATRLVNLRSWDFTTVTWNGTEVDNSHSITINNQGCVYCTGALSGIALQGANKWEKRDAGLYNNNSGSRNVAVLGLKAGDIVTVVTNNAISGLVNGTNTNETLNGTCVFSVNADGAFGFTYPRYNVISSITVQREEYFEASKTWDFVNSGYTTDNLPSEIDGLTINGNIDNRGDFTIQNGLRFRTNNGSVNIPVTAGQIVTLGGGTYNNSGRHGMIIYLTNAVDGSGNALTTGSLNDGGEFSCIAASNGVITLTRDNTGNSSFLTIPYITVFDPVAFNHSTCEAELIELNIDEPTICCPDGSEVTYSVSNEKIAKLGGEAHSGDLMGINTGVTSVNATVKYNNLTIPASYTLTISADEAQYVVEGNTYTLTGPGKLGERVVNSVPKMVMEFGENSESVTNITIVRNEDGIGNVATTLDSNGWQQLWYDGSNGTVLPYQGTFYTFKPSAAGKLTVKGYLRGANSVYLVDSENLANIPSDLTAQIGKAANSWKGTNLAPTWAAPAVTIGGRTYQMAEKYETTISETGTVLSQTVSGLPNGSYTVVLQANACFTDRAEITRPEGWTWDGSQAAQIANIYVETGAGRQNQAMTALNATSVNNNGRFTFDVQVTDGTLSMGIDKTAIGTNWHTIQIESLTFNDALQNYNFEPVFSYTPGSGFVDNAEVDVEAILKAGKTYYLYANIPSSNDVDAWGTYQLQSFTYESAWHFAERSVVVDFDDVTNYAGMNVETAVEGLNPNLTYTAIFKGNITGSIDASTGKITSISATGEDANKGGAIVVIGDDGTDQDLYVITVPYKNHTWDFWGLNGTRKYPSDLMEEDFDWAMNYEVRNYDTTTRNLYYLNEPILTAAQAVAGDNAAFIGETAGIVMNANAKTFGLRANVTGLTTYDNFKSFFLDGGENQAKYANFIEDYNLNSDEFTAEKFEELKADGAFVDKYLKVMLAYTDADLIKTDAQPNGTNIAAMTKGATMVIPHVKVGSHIAIKWYRHAENDGDHILLTNAEDLDGNAITNGVYVVNQGRGNNIFSNPYGWLEFKAAGNEGEYVDVTLTCEKGWTHIKAVALSEEFYDTNLAIVNDGSNSARKTVFNTTDGADSNTYATRAYYTRSENGVSYAYTLEDITGIIEGNYTINGGEISFNQGTQGTATLVLTAFSNGYAIDREWLPIKVGAYGDTHQDYPYTWNFTNINTGNLDGQENWTKDGDNYTVTPEATTAHLQDNELKKSATDEEGVAEFDELGIETPTNTDGTPTAIDLTITDNGNSTTTTVGDTGITFVVPDVPEDATVYVKVVPNSNSTVNISNGDGETSPSKKVLSDDTTVYTIDGTPEANDVTVELKNVEIQSIAVTNIFKEARMASASDEFRFYNSDCQAKDIDYDLTDYYTGIDMKAMFITSESFGEFDYDRETAVVNATPVTAPVSANTGLIVFTEDNEVLHPLFVPDVNTTERQNTEGNMLVGVLFDEETGTASTETLYKQVVTDPGTPYADLADYKDNIGTFTAGGTSELNSTVTIGYNDTKAMKFANSYNNGANYVEVTCDGGFKRGCIITYAGCINSGEATKTGAIQIYDENGNKLHESENFGDLKNGATMATGGSFELASDVQSLRIARLGNTTTYVVTFRVEWTGSEATTELVETPVTIYTGNVTPAENDTYRYLFTNQYNTVGQNNSLTSDEPGFYRLKEAGGKLKSNRAYLVIGQNVLKGNSVKAVYLKSFFNDDPDDDFSTVIELVEDNNAGIDMNGTFYTISGVKIQGMPTKSGIYIQNGKKIMVK